jgi:hypothetical protein
MPHVVDFDSVEQKLFNLQHLCYGSRRACEHYRINRETEAAEDYEWYEYAGILKTIVSTTVIEAAIKLRMVQDFSRAEMEDDEAVDWELIELQSAAGLTIGGITGGTGTLSLRESCNKIVHATEALLKWDVAPNGDGSIEYWSGVYRLWGSKGQVPWQVDINVADWCNAMIRLNKSLQLKIDWRRVSKWDE